MDAPKSVWHRDPKVRGILAQVFLLLFVGSSLYVLIGNAVDNLRAQHIASGFGFLDNPAGFGITQSLIPFNEQSTYMDVFWVGLLNTLMVSFVGIVLATIIGFFVGIARLSSNWVVSKLAGAFVEVMRNLPHLFHIFFWYIAVIRSLPSAREAIEPVPGFFLSIRGFYMPNPISEPGFMWVVLAFLAVLIGAYFYKRHVRKVQFETGKLLPFWRVILPALFGFPMVVYLLSGMPLHWEIPKLQGFNFVGGLRVIPEFIALVMALALYTAGFIAEIVRAGIQAISHGQTEAASSLGLPKGHTLRLVIIPQAMRVIIPPLSSQYLNLIKNSALGVAIGYPDFFAIFSGTVLNQTGQAIEIIAITMAVYLTISLATAALMDWYNRRVALVER